MNQQDNFYIGWQEKVPEEYKKRIRSYVVFVGLLFLLVPAIVVLSQQGFRDSQFELGKLTKVEGVLTKSPVPMLKVDKGGEIHSIILIGFGKFGAEKDIALIEEEEGDLEGKNVTLEGTMIYHKGKTLLELTKGTMAFIGKKDRPNTYQTKQSALGTVSLIGEILDPKCALGVMKPGYGKPHRSCAVRCIAGGITPVFRIATSNGDENYCVLVGKDGEMINEKVLPQVADQVRICGTLEQQDDWLVLYTDPEEDIITLQPHWVKSDIPMCGN